MKISDSLGCFLSHVFYHSENCLGRNQGYVKIGPKSRRWRVYYLAGAKLYRLTHNQAKFEGFETLPVGNWSYVMSPGIGGRHGSDAHKKLILGIIIRLLIVKRKKKEDTTTLLAKERNHLNPSRL